jgi:hypothetical protein
MRTKEKHFAFVDTTSILSNKNRGRRQPDPCPTAVTEKACLGLLLTRVDYDTATTYSLVHSVIIDNSLTAQPVFFPNLDAEGI